MGEKPYRAGQVLKWLHFQGVRELAAMTDLSKALREKLALVAEIRPLEIAYESTAQDGTHNWLLRLPDNNCIEAIYIPEKRPRYLMRILASWLRSKL